MHPTLTYLAGLWSLHLLTQLLCYQHRANLVLGFSGHEYFFMRVCDEADMEAVVERAECECPDGNPFGASAKGTVTLTGSFVLGEVFWDSSVNPRGFRCGEVPHRSGYFDSQIQSPSGHGLGKVYVLFNAKSRCVDETVSLILRPSQTVPGYYERVGIVTFSGSHKIDQRDGVWERGTFRII
ncbi:hypothetical protein DL769_004862 [Monosporascus sp. CRB-8-3]|nr:hypothetical protein DL769_004862 [Monosporascus sp. CRB-8-3]